MFLVRRLHHVLFYVLAWDPPKPPPKPKHVPLVAHRLWGFRGADSPHSHRRTQWQNAVSAAQALYGAYPNDAVIKRHHEEVMALYNWTSLSR